MNSGLKNKVMYGVLAFVVVIAILHFGSKYMNRDTETSDLTTEESASVVKGSEELTKLSRIENMSFDVDFFASKAFRDLEDNSVELQPGEKGKSDIFSPVAGASRTSVASSTAELNSVPAPQTVVPR
ncbi:MAG: hypothetical protein WC757_00520 [Candidatus Paceibacterota bacterium]|jgi:hypothetical protein